MRDGLHIKPIRSTVSIDGLEVKPGRLRTQEVVMASVLITGASKGIGRAAAAEFAHRGHQVIAIARDPLHVLRDLIQCASM